MTARTRIPLLSAAAAALACGVLPAPAPAAPRETRYDVTFEAEMVERWRFDEQVSRECAVGDGGGDRCDRRAVGQGSARIFLRTPRPQRVSVTSGIPRMQPTIVASIDRGIPLKGSYRRAGTFTDTYSGAWDAGNPDLVAPAGGCGLHTITRDVALGWSARNVLRPVLHVEELRACPTGSPDGFDYDGVPAIGEVPARVAASKFGRVAQFRVSGAKTWRGTVPEVNRTDPADTFLRHGASEIRWSWSATFRKVKPKGRGRGGRRAGGA